VTPPRTVGRDPAFRAAVQLARRVAPESSPVLLVGPTGCGKSHLAQWIHHWGPRRGPFLEWHSGAVPETLLEAELFGVHSGTATDVAERPGLFERAGEGTLCMAGVEALPSHQQAALLRVLETRQVERVGGGRPIQVLARLCATFLDSPELLVQRGALRPDLLYRLDVIRIEIPALAERPGDIPILADFFLGRSCRRLHREKPRLSQALIEVLTSHAWPGNCRELAHRMEHLALAGADPLTPADLPPAFWDGGERLESALRQRLTLSELCNAYMHEVLARVGGNRTQAAKWLGISRKALWSHLRGEVR